MMPIAGISRTMMSIAGISKSGGFERTHQMCRLCLSEESLEDVFREVGLQQLISDCLKITISTEDRLSHAICSICRLRLSEFLQFRMRCQEVQNVLQSMNPNEKVEFAAVKGEPVFDGGFSSKSQVQIGEFGQSSREIKGEPVAMGPQVKNEPYDENESKEIENVYCTDFDIEKQLDSINDIGQHQDFYSESADSNQLNEIDSVIVKEEVQVESREDDDAYTSSTVESEPPKKETSGTTIHQCEPCAKVFPSRKAFVEHDRRSHRPKRACPICEKLFRNESNMRTHMNLHLSKERQELLNNVGTQFNCDQCSKVFPHEYYLLAHKQFHKPNNFSCTICKKSFSFLNHLKHHLDMHSRHVDNKEDHLPSSPVKQREEELSTPNDAVQDSEPSNSLSVETEEGSKECRICHQSFGTQNDLSQHFSDTHQRKFNCPSCAAAFTSNELLKWHMSVLHNHTEDGGSKTELSNSATATASTPANFKCIECRKAFSTARQLATHKKGHGKPFVCPVCEERFSFRESLSRHVRVQHTNKDH